MALYRLPNGETASHRAVNSHHILFEKRWYKSQSEHQLRNLGGFVLPMWIPVHDELHANVEPPVKPTPTLREELTDFAHDLYYEDPYEAFSEITNFIGDLANSSRSSERAEEAFDLHDNLIRQSHYVDLGRVTLLEAA